MQELRKLPPGAGLDALASVCGGHPARGRDVADRTGAAACHWPWGPEPKAAAVCAGWLAAVRLNPSRGGGGGPAAWPLQVISGEEAALRGLVLRTADEPLAEALSLAERIAEQAPLAVRATTRALRCALPPTALLRCCAAALRGPT
eukprot:COSAG01_NODE_1008_length_12157_cov_17.425029_10_plen_146_part_00